MDADVLILESALDTELSKEFFNMLLGCEPENIVSFEAEDFEYMTLAKDLKEVYEAYGWDAVENLLKDDSFFSFVCEIPEGKIYMLRREWR